MATNNLFNVPSWTSIQELLYRRLGIELIPELVSYSLNPAVLLTAVNEQFGQGDGVSNVFGLKVGGEAISSVNAVTDIYCTDWQGRQLLYPTPRTNQLLYSQDFTNAPWIKNALTVTVDSVTAPDGSTGVDLINFSTNGQMYVFDNSGVTGSKVFSFYVSPGTLTSFAFIVIGGVNLVGGGTNSIFLNLTGAGSVTSGQPGSSVTIVQRNGYYLVTVFLNVTVASGNSTYFRIAGIYGAAGSLHLWGAQLSPGSTAKSYILTTSAAVTVTDYTYNVSGQVTLAKTPVIGAVLNWDGTGFSVPSITVTAKPTAPDGSKNPYHGSVTFPIDKLQVSNELPATLVWSDLFPMMVDALADYLFKNYGYYMEDGEFFMVGDPSATPLVRGGGEVYNGLNVQTRQFSLRATPGAVRWNAGSTILFQLATSNSVVSLDGFSITSGAPPAGVYDTPYSYTYTVTGGTPPYNFSVLEGTSVAPINPSTGVMSSSNLTTAETFSWIVQVTDNVGRVVTRQEVVSVTVPPLSMSPSTFSPTVTVGVPVSFSLGVSGGEPPYAYSVYLNSLPSTVSLQGGSVVGTFEGSLTQTQTSMVVGIQVTDNVGTVIQRLFTFTINDRTTAQITASLNSKVIHWYEYSSAVYAGAATIGVGAVLYDAVGHANMQVAFLPGYDSTAIIGSVAGLGSQGTLFALTGGAYAHTNTVAFNLPDDFAIMAVVNLASPGAAAGQALLSRGGDANGGYELQVGTDSTSLALELDMSGSLTNVAFPTQFLAGTGNNYHVILQKFDNIPEIVVNAGTAVDMSVLSGILSPNSTDALFMGAHPDLNASSIFKGGMGMVSLFSEKLWSDERKWLYNGGTLRVFSELGYWPTLGITPSSSITSITLGQAFTLTYTLSGGSGAYVNAGWTAGSQIPPGLVATYDGNVTITISGTPTVAGTYSFGVGAVSTDGQSSSQTYTNVQVVDTTVTYTTFPANVGNNGIYTDSTGLVVTPSSTYYAYPAALLTSTPMAGKVYFEAALLESDPTYGGTYIGVADATATIYGGLAYPASSATSAGFYPGDAGGNGGGTNFWLNGTYTVYPNTTTTDNLQIGVAVDVAARLAWFCVVGQGWIGGGDPAAGTLGAPIGGTSGIYAMASFYSYGPGQSVTLCNTPGSLQGTAPAGFTAGIVV